MGFEDFIRAQENVEEEDRCERCGSLWISSESHNERTHTTTILKVCSNSDCSNQKTMRIQE